MRRLLVVDDDPAVRELVVALLTDEPVDVLQATSGEEALALAERDGEAVDVVVSDVELPGICGYETVRRLLAHFPRLESIIISGAAQDVPGHARATRPSAFLRKPFERAELLALVRAALGSGAA